jgi:hypothetical protein
MVMKTKRKEDYFLFSNYINDESLCEKIIQELNLDMQSILYKCIEYEFINIKQIEIAVNILKQFSEQNDFYFNCCESTDYITRQLILGSEI